MAASAARAIAGPIQCHAQHVVIRRGRLLAHRGLGQLPGLLKRLFGGIRLPEAHIQTAQVQVVGRIGRLDAGELLAHAAGLGGPGCCLVHAGQQHAGLDVAGFEFGDPGPEQFRIAWCRC